MNITKIKKYFPYVYIILLVFITLFVRYSLSDETSDIKEVDNEKKVVEEVKPVKVSLVVEAFGNIRTFTKTMQNIDTFDDLLEDLRDEDKLNFEKTEYTYGTDYHDIAGIQVPDGYVWSVYAGGENVTYNTNRLLLQDNWIYRLVLEKK